MLKESRAEELITKEAFHAVFQQIVDQQAIELGGLLRENKGWSVEPDFEEMMRKETIVLARHYLKRTMLFARHRTKDKTKKVKLEMEDITYADDSVNMDAL